MMRLGGAGEPLPPAIFQPQHRHGRERSAAVNCQAMMTAQWMGIVAALSPPLAGLHHPDSLVKILNELVAAGSLVREVDPVTGMTVYREPSE
jgi:hypothetical protein